MIAAADLLIKDFKIQSDIWSILGINQLHRDGMEVEDWNRNHPEKPSRKPYAEKLMKGHQGPAIISTDYVQAYSEQIRRLIPNKLSVLGTDGYGRSDSRKVLRDFFKVDRFHIVITALKALADEGKVPQKIVSKAVKLYSINPDAPHALKR